MIRWVLTAFFTSILLSCLVACCIAACILHAFLRFCFSLSWPYAFWTKINGIYEWEFLGVSKEPNPLSNSRTWARSILTRCEKNLRQFIQKWVKKRKRKIINIVMCYALTLKRKNLQRYLKTSVFYLRLFNQGTLARQLPIWSHLLKKSFMENFTFCAMLIPKIA